MIIFLSIAAALIVTGLAFMSFSASKRFMRAALYHYYMDHKEVLLEAHGDSAPLPALAFQMAAEALHNMGQNPNQSRFCFDVMEHQRKLYGTRSRMLIAARQRGFPE